MKTTCPHCAQSISIDPETLSSLQGTSHFECPACSAGVPVPQVPGPQPIAPLRDPDPEAISLLDPPADADGTTVLAAHRGMNRNLLILGSVTLLVLGGLATFIASRKEGNVHNTRQVIRNEITNNSFFKSLITSGTTTARDLESVTGIREDGSGFIGVSKDKMTWDQSLEFAKKVGGEILDPGLPDSMWRVQRTDLVTEAFPELLGSTVWVAEKAQPRAIDSPDVHPVSTLERPRRLLLQWQPWRALISTSFDNGSPFGVTNAPTWTSKLERGHFTLRRTDSGTLWLDAGGSRAGNATRIQTRARIVNDGIFAEKAPSARWGLLFRANNDGYFAVEIRGDGCWQFYVAGKKGQTISSWQFSNHINKAGLSNEIVVEAVGPRFTIEANGNSLGSFENETYSSGHQTLLFASSGDAYFEFDSYHLLEHNPNFPHGNVVTRTKISAAEQ
ncbi:MAG: hypothetical protein H7X97_03170 [Opitutaceae bacterium]|nr:hypothetical protein [Verrucomicrobiales bacterium]